MKIWVWGANNNGQLGLGYKSEQVSSPTELTFNLPSYLKNAHPKPVDICGGATSTIALINFTPSSSQGDKAKTKTASDNDGDKRTTTTTSSSSAGDEGEPWITKITNTFQLLQHPQIDKIASGFDSYFYLFDGGQLESFGDNYYCQLGRMISEGELKEQEQSKMTYTTLWEGINYARFAELNLDLPFFTSVSASIRHVAAISTSKDLYVWGDNSKYQVGIFRISPNGQEEFTYRVLMPAKVPFPAGYNFTKVACGKDFTIAMHDTGCLFGCGQNRNGVLLHAPQDIKEFRKFTHIFDNVSNEADIWDIKCGWSHVVVLLTDGRVMSWGRNDLGQLGRESVNPNFDVEPGYVNIPDKVISIKCGSEHNLALTLSGKVYAWGWNEHDNCGVGRRSIGDGGPDSDDDTTPFPFPVDVEGGLDDGNTGTSSNSSNGAGFSHRVERKDCVLFPTEVTFPEENTRILVIGCGAGSSYAISSD